VRVLRAIIALGLVAGAVLVPWRLGWHTLSAYELSAAESLPAPIMSADEYAELAPSHARPYVVRIEGRSGALLLFGAVPTRDPDHPQVEQMRQLWSNFRPTTATCEGRLGLWLGGLASGVQRFGMPAVAYALARDDGLPVYTLDTDAADLVHEVHCARVLLDLAQRGERVFAVVDARHAVRLERCLRAGVPSS
jgi:hypothetical protein